MPAAGAPTATGPRLWLDAAVVLAAAGVAVLAFLHRAPLEIWDEAVFCDTTANMLRHRQWWWPPDEGGAFFAWYGKPPLVNWLQLLATAALGWTPLALRLPTALGGIGLILAIWWTALTLGGRQVAGLAAALAIASAPLVGFVRHVWTETLLGVCFAVGLGLWAAAANERGRRADLFALGAGAVLGLAVLTKQASAGFAVVGLIGADLWLCRRAALRRLVLVGGALTLTAGWWFALAAVQVGRPLWDSLVDQTLVQRAVEAVDGHGRHPNDYARELEHWLGIGSWVLGLLGWLAVGHGLGDRSKRLWLAWSVLAASHYLTVGVAMRTFNPWYPFPLVPLFYAGAAFLAVAAWRAASPWWLRWLLPTLAAAVVARSLNVSEVPVVLAVLLLALAWERRPMLIARRAARAWQWPVLACAITLAVSRPWTLRDDRYELALLVTEPTTALAIADRAKWRRWRCYLPAAEVHEWRGSCAAISPVAATITQLILEGPAANCPVAGFAVEQRRGDVALLSRQPRQP